VLADDGFDGDGGEVTELGGEADEEEQRAGGDSSKRGMGWG
jgi:hypothetical protein